MEIAPLDPNDEAGFDQLLAIYREAIDPSEQKTEAGLRDMRVRDSSLILVAREAGAVSGFAILFAPRDGDFAMLEYMAVAPGARGQGLGERLFRAGLAALPGRPLLIEIEQEEPAKPGADLRFRRLGFYGRLGCSRLGTIDYQLPLRTTGLPPPLLLGVHGLADAAPRETARRWLVRSYVEVYGQPADDPRIDEMLAGEDDPVPLTPLRPGLRPTP